MPFFTIDPLAGDWQWQPPQAPARPSRWRWLWPAAFLAAFTGDAIGATRPMCASAADHCSKPKATASNCYLRKIGGSWVKVCP